jgi:hypothetical protein
MNLKICHGFVEFAFFLDIFCSFWHSAQSHDFKKLIFQDKNFIFALRSKGRSKLKFFSPALWQKSLYGIDEQKSSGLGP